MGFAKVLSPNVDVGITNEKDYPSYAEDDDKKQSSIDERLKKLQMEDNGEMFSPELDEKIVLPSQKEKKAETKEKLDGSELELRTSDKTGAQQSHIQETKNLKESEQKETTTKEVQPTSHAQTTQTPTQMSYSRVVVGSYASEKQAEIAKAALQESGVGITPIIKNVGGSYTLQVGSYSTKEKAQQAAANLVKNNLPARVLD